MTSRSSIVVPTYNEEKYITPLLESVDRQTVAPLELILVDGSDDGTRTLAKKHSAKIINQDVRRVSWARMRGFQEAKGEFIISSDADTILDNDYVRNAEMLLSDSNVAAVFGPVYLADGPWLFKLMSRTLFSAFLRASVWIGRPNLNGMNFVCRRDAYTVSGGFDPEMITGEDVFLGQRLRKVGKVVYSPKVRVYTSARRITGMGGWKFIWHHTKNFVRVATGRASSNDFQVFR